MDKITIDSADLVKILDYLEHDEKKSFDESDKFVQKNHIWNSIYNLKKALPIKKKFKVDWGEYHSAIVEAKNEEEAYEIATQLSSKNTYEGNIENEGETKEIK